MSTYVSLVKAGDAIAEERYARAHVGGMAGWTRGGSFSLATNYATLRSNLTTPRETPKDHVTNYFGPDFI